MSNNFNIICAFVAGQTVLPPKRVIRGFQQMAQASRTSMRCTYHPGAKLGAALQIHILLGTSPSTLVPVGCCDAVVCLDPEEGLRALSKFSGARFAVVADAGEDDRHMLDEMMRLGAEVITPKGRTDPLAWLIGATLSLPGSPFDPGRLKSVSGLDVDALAKGRADAARSVEGVA